MQISIDGDGGGRLLTITAIILVSVSLSAMAHVFLKVGMGRIAATHGGQAALKLLVTASTSPWVIFGIFLHVTALSLWLYVLSQVEVSYAYPFISVGFVLVLVASHFFLNESVSALRIAGVILIIAGVFLVSRS